MKQTQYELSERVLLTKGSLRLIGEKLGISKGYVSMLKKVRASGAAATITYWRRGELPWMVARALANLPKGEQLPILKVYLDTSRRAETTPGKRAAQRAAIDAVKEARGLGPDPGKEAAREKARRDLQDDDCQIDDGKVIEDDDGYWVPAHLWIAKEEA